MGKVLPFSSIDTYLKSLKAPVSVGLVNAQFLVAATEELHQFYEDSGFHFEKLA